MPKILTWSLGVQHELARNTSIEVRYLGTRGLELPVQFRRNLESAFDAGITRYRPSSRHRTFRQHSRPARQTDTPFNNFTCLTNSYAKCTVDPNFVNNTYFKTDSTQT